MVLGQVFYVCSPITKWDVSDTLIYTQLVPFDIDVYILASQIHQEISKLKKSAY